MSVQVRITQGMMSSNLLSNLRRADVDIARTSNQISSGRRIDSPSDDSVGATRALVVSSQLTANERYQASANAAVGWTQTTEGALSSIVDLVQGARELIVQTSNDTLLPSDRQKLGLKLGELLQQIKATANARYGDQYVLSGQRSDTPPYTSGASDAYAGDAAAVIRTIGPNQPVQVNVTGADVLGAGGGDGKLIDTLRAALGAIQSGTDADMTNLRGPVLQQLDVNLDSVLTARAQAASANVRAQLASDRVDDLRIILTDQLSQIRDTDYAQAITQLNSQKTVYQAALQAGAAAMQPTLMDFLR